MRAIADPLGYGWEGRIKIDTEDLHWIRRKVVYGGPQGHPAPDCTYPGIRIETDLRVNEHVSRGQFIPPEMRFLYLLAHGYYSVAEVLDDPAFLRHYVEVGGRKAVDIDDLEEAEKFDDLLKRVEELEPELDKKRPYIHKIRHTNWCKKVEVWVNTDDAVTNEDCLTVLQRYIEDLEDDLKKYKGGLWKKFLS